MCFHCGFLSDEANQLTDLVKVAFYPMVILQVVGGGSSWVIWTLAAGRESQAKSSLLE